MLEYDRVKLGKHLKSKRVGANLTQAQVSRKLGYSSPQFVSNIERGISVVPLKTLSRMIGLYKSDVDVTANIILESQKALLREKLKLYIKKN